MCNISMGVINMLSSLTVAIVVIIALFISNRTNRLQRESIQANMFNDITEMINKLIDEMPEKDKLSEDSYWHTKVLNAFDHFCFYVNRKSFSLDMELYYKNYIIGFCDTLNKNCPKTIIKLQPNTLTEIRKYYRKHTGKDLSF